MKRILLWITNVLLLMVLSASHSAPQSADLVALGAPELTAVTAGICETCNPYPYIKEEGWDLIGRQTSAHTTISTRVIQQLVNSSSSASIVYSTTYDNNCTYRWTGGSANVGSGIGISLNRVYQCSSPETLTITLPPRSSATLYEGTKRYYVTETYRHYMLWSDGYRELSGHTETFRKEYTYSFREIR
jgi:hypothetical protein